MEMSMPAPTPIQRNTDYTLVDSENTLTTATALQQHLITSNNSNPDVSAKSIFCVEKTTTNHHNYYDIERHAGVIGGNMLNPSSSGNSRKRLIGMGDPSVIANWGFASVYMLMALHKLVLPTNSNNFMFPVALVYGGLAQFIAGFLKLLTGDTFNGTLFVSFGAYWLGAGALMIPAIGGALEVYAGTPDQGRTTAIYLLMWATFALMAVIITTKLEGGSFIGTFCLSFVSLNLVLEAVYNLTGNVNWMYASGVACIPASLSGYYIGIVDLFADQGVQLWTGKYKH
ncbi:GPR1/FUN34/yaaH family-domain-containing protein [Mycotypha africana]|uniref:GPR1/FUN34/yaaH family-domain-containing protein n=1 Tax=Mycotypha africana TaxID=64632 RepID=UPI0023017CE0|nr:GPR1/FUN34/yaaH family-domain-containing protein [Mycotypha africana]KAI8988395.1 GPR1/FUN34/yaaH family-domain-containing protein [Mycotypha africana]